MFDFTEKNPRFFYNPEDFNFLNSITSNFSTIKNELLDLLHHHKEYDWFKTFPHYVKSNDQKTWKIFSFLFFNMKVTDNAKLCPKTAELIYNIPEILSCDFSNIEAHTKILPHKGYTKMVLRCHLPLIVPNEELCALKVGNEIKHWREGELIIFDDSFIHEAWNNSDQNRIVLMFDIPNPLWGYNAQQISSHKIKNIDDPFLLSMAKKEEWISAFQSGIFPINLYGSK